MSYFNLYSRIKKNLFNNHNGLEHISSQKEDSNKISTIRFFIQRMFEKDIQIKIDVDDFILTEEQKTNFKDYVDYPTLKLLILNLNLIIGKIRTILSLTNTNFTPINIHLGINSENKDNEIRFVLEDISFFTDDSLTIQEVLSNMLSSNSTKDSFNIPSLILRDLNFHNVTYINPRYKGDTEDGVFIPSSFSVLQYDLEKGGPLVLAIKKLNSKTPETT